MKDFKSINPYNGKTVGIFERHGDEEIEELIQGSNSAFKVWRHITISDRAELMLKVSDLLCEKKDELAKAITLEMGKPIKESVSEIEKCAWVCEFYAANAEDFLADEIIETDADESFISYDPIGCVLAIMPWNFPFWQVFRFAAPTLMAGNTCLLKHASNVQGCAEQIQKLFEEAGFPIGAFQVLRADHKQLESVIEHSLIKAVTLTGSEGAGTSIASIAGKNIKKTVLELGGNNACIVLNDANLDATINTAVTARMLNTGQSCIAAKRFIVQEEIYDTFLKRFSDKVKELKSGDPMDESTEIGTLAREDLAADLLKQVDQSVSLGAIIHLGGNREGAYFEPTIITEVRPGMPVFDEETFGPVAAISKVNSESEAYQMAANSTFGLGTMVLTKDIERAKEQISFVPDGSFFINELVKSDPRLPFGGTNRSGYGRELSREGILEFVNKKTVYVKA